MEYILMGLVLILIGGLLVLIHYHFTSTFSYNYNIGDWYVYDYENNVTKNPFFDKTRDEYSLFEIVDVKDDFVLFKCHYFWGTNGAVNYVKTVIDSKTFSNFKINRTKINKEDYLPDRWSEK